MDTSEAGAMETFQKRWMLENNVQTADSIFKYDKEEQQSLRAMKPWERDPNYFKVNFLTQLILIHFLGSQDVGVGTSQDGHSCSKRRKH
jgi:hypothetical protein